MATGTGKTYTAFQIVYRLLRSDLKKRILYLADRNILVDQSILQDFAPLEKTIYKVDFSDKECLSKIASHEVNFALYHQMVGQNDEEHFRQIPAEYFDLIIVDSISLLWTSVIVEVPRRIVTGEKCWSTFLLQPKSV